MEEHILNWLAKLYGASVKQIKTLGAWHNHVFEVRTDQPFIIRVSNGGRRSLSEIRAEIDFLRYLREQGATVAGPILATDGESLHSLQQGNTTWHACAFEKALGLSWRERDCDITSATAIGATIGRTHQLSRAYTSVNTNVPRRYWHQNGHLELASKLLMRHFHIDNGEAIVFDFDDYEWHWFVYDLAPTNWQQNVTW